MHLREISGWFDPDALTIGFARRFATYKRAPLIFRDLDRIEADRRQRGLPRPVDLRRQGTSPAINSGRPSPRRSTACPSARAFKWSGWRFSRNTTWRSAGCSPPGATSGSTTPRRPHEASGTSGMKPPLHGGLNLSILDGWWPEGFDGRNGWAIGDEAEFENNR